MKKTFFFLLFSLCLFSVSAKVYSVKATLNGANEVPPNASTGTGTLTGTFDDVTGVLNYTLTYSGLTGPITGSHFHNAAIGVNGGVVIGFSPSTNPFTSAAPFPAPQIANLLAGNIYVNLHTTANPGGEIRGQLIATELVVFTAATQNDFKGIGGYSFTQETFPAGVQTNPYIITGPLPQNDFTFVASAVGGITNVGSSISTTNINTPLTITFKGNNVRKFGCRAFASIFGGGGTTPDIIQLTATTNLGNTAVLTGSTSNLFVGFRVLYENEYITSIVAQFQSLTATTIALRNIIFGDDSPQNVSLNFDGLDDFVSIPSNVGNFNFNQAFTVSCWVKPALAQVSIANADNEILEKWDQTGSYPFVIRYLNFNAGADAGKVRVARYDGSNNPAITSTVNINDNKWHHIALTTTGGNMGTMNLYIDGVKQGTGVTDNTNANTTNTSPLFVGQRGNNINHFKGEIDEVRIWTVAKSETDIQNEMFCKNPITTNLQAAYNFNNGVPNGNNALLTQVQDAVGSNHGILNNFAKIGDASNWVTGQVIYVKPNGTGTNSSSWATTNISLQTALFTNPCNDLFDIYVASGTYKQQLGNQFITFIIRSGMKIYGGFANTEKNINERNMALIHTTNKTTLSGDLNGNDTPFNFSSNRTDNSNRVVYINGGYVSLDGITVSGGSEGIYKDVFGDVKISNCKIIDNTFGLRLENGNSTVSNCIMAGNDVDGVYMRTNSANFQNCVIANNGRYGIFNDSFSTNSQVNISNSTIASNANAGIQNDSGFELSIINNIKNTIIKDNAGGGIVDGGGGVTTNNITYSLVENQFVNTANPQFVSPLPNSVRSDLGDYRLKWCSLAINAGDNTGISPLDLDRKPRNFNTTADMGAYEFLGNTPSQVATSTIIGTIDSPTYAGGAIQTITSTAKILAPAGAIDFKAPNSITLNPGFEARGVGKYFKAEIGANVGCSN